MNFHLFHRISGWCILLLLISKIITHYYLDYLNNRSLGLTSIPIMPLQYLLPYKYNVNSDLKNWKSLCNMLALILYGSLLLNILFGALIYLLEGY